YSPGGDYLVVSPGPTGGLELWDGGAARRLASWSPPSGAGVVATAFAPGGKELWSLCGKGRVQALSLPGLAPGRHWSVPPAAGDWEAGLLLPDRHRLV